MFRRPLLLYACAAALAADTLLVLAIGGGVNLGTILPGVIGLALAVGVLFRGRLTALCHDARFRAFRRALLAGAFVWLVTLVAVEGLILAHAYPRAPDSARWLVVLGAGLRGERPSLTLQRRLDEAAVYAHAHANLQIIVTGGKGAFETISEAAAMRRSLVERGVSSERIHMEDQAASTLENLRFSKAIIEAHGGPGGVPIAVLSNEFHLFRVSMIAARLNMRVAGISAHTPWYLLPNVLLREYFAVFKSLLLDR